MDLFSEILKTIKLHGTVYFHAHFHAPWGMEIPQGEFSNYHIVTSGCCWLQVDGCHATLLQQGDMVLFPRGASHALIDSPHSTTVSAQELMQQPRKNQANEIVFGGEGQVVTSLICGHFEYDRTFAHPLFETLPAVIHICAGQHDQPNWFATASDLAAQVSSSDNIGKHAIVDRLAETLFIQALTDYVGSLADPSSFLAALQDRNIGLALKAMHEDITHDWTLAELAQIAAMAKSVFSEKFRHLVGTPPIVYLAQWRMLKAREMLMNTTLPISQISERVGYQTEFSFSKAFKKMTGSSPGAVRKAVKHLQ